MGKKITKKQLILGSTVILTVLTVGVYFSLALKPEPASSLLANDSNPYSIENGVILVNNGATSPADAEEFNSKQVNFFSNNELSENTSTGEVFKMSNKETVSEFAEKTANSLGLTLMEEKTLDDSGDAVLVRMQNANNEEFLLSVYAEEYSNMKWEYSNSVASSKNPKCPSVEEPLIFSFMKQTEEEIIAATPPGEPAILFPDYATMTPEELNETFFMEAYNLASTEYVEKCDTVETPNSATLEKTALLFIEQYGLTNMDTQPAVTDDEGLTKVDIYQKINNHYGPKTAEVYFNNDETIVKAEGLNYVLESLGTVETLSPSESTVRTMQEERILAEIHPNYLKGYNNITTTSPEAGGEYELNGHKKIYLTLSTIDGYLFTPGWLLYDNDTKNSIYTVSIPDAAFKN